MFSRIRPIDPTSIELGQGNVIQAKEAGDIDAKVVLNNSEFDFTFRNVLFAPDMQRNLISMISWIKQGYLRSQHSRSMHYQSINWTLLKWEFAANQPILVRVGALAIQRIDKFVQWSFLSIKASIIDQLIKRDLIEAKTSTWSTRPDRSKDFDVIDATWSKQRLRLDRRNPIEANDATEQIRFSESKWRHWTRIQWENNQRLDKSNWLPTTALPNNSPFNIYRSIKQQRRVESELAVTTSNKWEKRRLIPKSISASISSAIQWPTHHRATTTQQLHRLESTTRMAKKQVREKNSTHSLTSCHKRMQNCWNSMRISETRELDWTKPVSATSVIEAAMEGNEAMKSITIPVRTSKLARISVEPAKEF